MNKLFQISEAASLAIHSLAIIAKTNELQNVSSITEMTNFSKNHLSKVLQQLVKFGYIESARGPKGGFKLSRNSKEVTLLEIYETIEGKVEIKHCTVHNGECPFDNCIMGDLSAKFTGEFLEYMRNTTLYDVSK